MNDLPEAVFDHLDEICPPDAVYSYRVHRHISDGSAAVTFVPGIADQQTVALQVFGRWAVSLDDAGFDVQTRYAWPGQPEPVREDGQRFPLWLNITGGREDADAISGSKR